MAGVPVACEAVDGVRVRVRMAAARGAVLGCHDDRRIRHSDVQAWVTQLGAGNEGRKPKSPTIVRRCHDILAGILETAVRDHLIPSNPARRVNLPRRISRPHTYLTNDQVAQLVAASGEHATVIALLANTGLRWGEASPHSGSRTSTRSDAH